MFSHSLSLYYLVNEKPQAENQLRIRYEALVFVIHFGNYKNYEKINICINLFDAWRIVEEKLNNFVRDAVQMD